MDYDFRKILNWMKPFIGWGLAMLGGSISAHAGETPQSGIYMSMGFGGQYTYQSWGTDLNLGLGIRAFFIGLGAEAHYIYNYGQVPGLYSTPQAEALYLGRLEIFPKGDFKIAALWGAAVYALGGNQNPPTNQAVGGVRIAYEGHIGPVFSMEPAFSALQSIGPVSYQSYMLTLTFGLWNEAFLSTLIYSALTRRGRH